MGSSVKLVINHFAFIILNDCFCFHLVFVLVSHASSFHDRTSRRLTVISSSSHHTLGVGAIIGIVIGILVWLSLVAFGILLLRRRCTASNADAYPPAKYDSEPPMAEPTRRGSLVPNRSVRRLEVCAPTQYAHSPGQLALPAPHVLPSVARISHPPAYENHSADSRIHVEDDL
jgi:hypothetical protein